METDRLVVMQWNIGNADSIRCPAASLASDLGQIARTIACAGPHVVTLQEVDGVSGHGEALARLLGNYRLLASDRLPRGRAILARDGVEGREAPDGLAPPVENSLSAAVRVPGGPWWLLACVHSPARRGNTGRRDGLHRGLAQWLPAVGHRQPVLIGGDLNVDPEPSRLQGRLGRLGPLSLINPFSSDWGGDADAMRELLAATCDLGAGAGTTVGLARRWREHLGPLGRPAEALLGRAAAPRLRMRLDFVLGGPGVCSRAARVLRVTGPGTDGAIPGAPMGWMDHDPLVVEAGYEGAESASNSFSKGA